MNSIQEVIEKLYDLNVGVVGTGASRHERPHKPIMLLAVLDLISQGKARADRIEWSQELRQRFRQYFEKVKGENDKPTSENPFFYLRGDKIWMPLEISNGLEKELDRVPTASDANGHEVSSRLAGGLENFVGNADQRNQLRNALLSRYFPQKRAELIPLFAENGILPPASGRRAKEDSEPYGRNPAFRRKVLEVYDYQCAACGLRIKLPDVDLTFVDGAHLIPFGISRNDHPTNGIALCKNHHWAMDKFLLVPSISGIWKVSVRLDPRRSPGEQALLNLNGEPILPPHDDAFRPSSDSVRWRQDRLLA